MKLAKGYGVNYCRVSPCLYFGARTRVSATGVRGDVYIVSRLVGVSAGCCSLRDKNSTSICNSA